MDALCEYAYLEFQGATHNLARWLRGPVVATPVLWPPSRRGCVDLIVPLDRACSWLQDPQVAAMFWAGGSNRAMLAVFLPTGLTRARIWCWDSDAGELIAQTDLPT